MQSFTINEFRVYLESQESLLEAIENLTETSIRRVNQRVEEEEFIEDLDEDDDEFFGNYGSI